MINLERFNFKNWMFLSGLIGSKIILYSSQVFASLTVIHL